MPKRTIYVQGKAGCKKEADRAKIHFDIVGAGKTQKSAEKDQAHKYVSLSADFIAFGLKSGRDFSTLSLNTREKTKWEDGKTHKDGFETTHSLFVDCEIGQAGALCDLLAKNSITGARVQPFVEMTDALNFELRTQALKNAKAIADCDAGALDMIVGEPRKVAVTHSEHQRQDGRRMGGQMLARASMSVESSPTTQLEAGEQTFIIYARVTFDLLSSK